MSAEGNVDVAVQQEFFPEKRPGVLVEVGAAHPEYLSLGKHFRELGWRVISVEPNPDFCAEFRRRGLPVWQFACSYEDDDESTFQVVTSHDAKYHDGEVTFESFSSLGIRDQFADLQATVKTDVREISVKVRRLDRLMSELAPDVRKIDLLAIDVEGWELEVMRGFDLTRYRPKVVILENVFDDEKYREYMKTNKYIRRRVIAPNEIYVRENFSHEGLLTWLRKLAGAIGPRRAKPRG